jgi:putative ABC transport system substrate-binding protein
VRRREFITLVGGAAAGWPPAARAQQPAKPPTVGFLGASTSSNWSHWTAAFVQRLRELGWIEGRTVAIEYRWADGRNERFVEIASEFARLKVDIILTVGSAVPAAKQATATIPIVFALAGDPVESGLVATLARPGGNVTGLSIPNERSCRQADRTSARGCSRPPSVGNHRPSTPFELLAGNRRSPGSSPQARP